MSLFYCHFKWFQIDFSNCLFVRPYTYTGTEAVTLTIPAAVENQALSITCGGQVYTYDGTTAVSLDIPEQAANKSLNITIGGDTYSYDGTEQIDITISAAEGGAY